jgi:hypothetical protein
MCVEDDSIPFQDMMIYYQWVLSTHPLDHVLIYDNGIFCSISTYKLLALLIHIFQSVFQHLYCTLSLSFDKVTRPHADIQVVPLKGAYIEAALFETPAC